MDCKKESQPEFHHFHAGDVARYAKFYELRSNLTSDSTPLESFLWRKYFDARAAVLRDGERELGLLWLYGTEDEPYAAMPLAREEDLPACFAALQRYFREVLKKPLIVKLADEGAVRALQLPEDQYLVEEEENAADYLYDGNALRTLSGRNSTRKRTTTITLSRTTASAIPTVRWSRATTRLCSASSKSGGTAREMRSKTTWTARSKAFTIF